MGPIRIEFDGDQVELYLHVEPEYGNISTSSSTKWTEFGRSQRLFGSGQSSDRAAFDLDEVQDACFAGHEVEFVMVAAPITVQQVETSI